MTLDTAQQEQTIHIERSIDIKAPPATVFESVLAELGPESQMPGGQPFPMVLEAWPGGRWFRDLGNKAGHLWGHVQVIKPPTLLEISGPMFVSFPAINHVQYRLTAQDDGTNLKLVHRALGLVPAGYFDGVEEGWEYGLERIREIAERSRRQR